ncbi:molybdopterin molybdotransferase MoeA [Streptomyces piniterrae]|uniref:Molybdopterin molybdenumtransferase n=1 Tax=Streptomyces piniterrae TaxID=2571125 RepID=A0A4U0N977_9ACTN|nr:molybdopterin molybdotransferase MoeA [Streptomyces piniterrae]
MRPGDPSGTGPGDPPGTGPGPGDSPGSTPGAPQPRPSPSAVPRSSAPWPTAREIAARAVPGPPAPTTATLADALGRTLAEPLAALTDLPSFDTSAMDGWAVSGPGPWDIDRPGEAAAEKPQDTADKKAAEAAVAAAAEQGAEAEEPAAGQEAAGKATRDTAHHAGILAGHAPTQPLPDGHAIRIATGARVPAGATAVLRSEHGEVRDLADGRARLYAPRPAPPGQDIRPRGQECRRGDQLLPAGTLVTPAVLGLAAAAGYDELTAYPRPRVEFLVLGDELLHHGLPQEGRIRDALGPMLAPWLRALGADAAPARHLADEADTLYAAIATSTADVLITTGGTASGPVDHVHPTLRRLGAEVLVDGVQVRPGHPMLLARLGPRRHLVGLPGNPLAAVSGLLTLAEPLLRTLTGRRPAAVRRAPLFGSVHGHPRDTRLVPVAYRDDARYGVTAEPLHFHGPAMLRGIAAAAALAVVPPGGADRGTEVELLELPWSASGSADWPAPGAWYDPVPPAPPVGGAG